MVHYVVTGGAGFIGSHLVRRLLGLGHRVTVLDNFSTGKVWNIPPGADVWTGDIRDPGVMRAVLADADGCFHLAAVASVQKTCIDWLASTQVNLAGTVAVFEAARANGIRPAIPVVYASSAAVYGDVREFPTPETAPKAPISAYGVDKLSGEMHAAVGWKTHGVPSVGLRFFNVYGPGQDPSSPYSGVISIFARRIANREPITIHGDGMQLRDFVFVEDVVDHLVAAMGKAADGARVYNVCTGRTTSISQLAEQLMFVCGRVVERRREPAREGDIRTSLGNPTLAVRELGVAARTTLADGLRRTLAGVDEPLPMAAFA
ncbi:MAG TPA: NAD-dependent epimerase/dehydratase family protein [Azospirillaceae bacterium]|nr:NAD-dependent epimerase/dehydratase family protein [Azospirillaceae bacterium]